MSIKMICAVFSKTVKIGNRIYKSAKNINLQQFSFWPNFRQKKNIAEFSGEHRDSPLRPMRVFVPS